MNGAKSAVAGVREILARHGYEPRHLVAILQDVQAARGYLPQMALEQIAGALGVPLSSVYRVATFYRSFSLKPKGRHRVTVCLGTACHVRGGSQVLDALLAHLGIEAGGTTADGLFTVETVNCLGACALGPLVVIDGEYHTNMSGERAISLVQKFSQRAQGRSRYGEDTGERRRRS